MLVDKSTGILGDMLTNISTKYRSVFCQYGGRHSVNTVTFKCQQNIGQLSVVYWSTVDHLNYQHTREFDQNFSKKSNAWRLAWAKHGLFWSRSSQNADYRLLQTIVFTTQSERDKNSPTDCFLTLNTMVCMIQSAVCILYSPVLEWTGTPLVH